MLLRAQPPQETETSTLFAHSRAWGMHSSRQKRTAGILNGMLGHSHQLAGASEDRGTANASPSDAGVEKLSRDGLP